MRLATSFIILGLFLTGCVATSPRVALDTWDHGAISIDYVHGELPGEGRRKLALLVQAQIDGRTCRMQLDTGVPDAVIWGLDEHRGQHFQADSVTLRAGPLERRVPVSPAVRARLARCSEGESVGTLGNAFFEQGSLRLNLAIPSLHYMSGSALARDVTAMTMRYARWNEVGGHTLVPMRSEEGSSGYALLDTGSVPVGLAVFSPQDWKAATRDAPLALSKDVRQIEAQAWGRKLMCYATDNGVLWSIGQISFKAVAVVYCPEHKLFTAPEPLLGVLGMQAFQHGTLTLDYVGERWRLD